MKRKTISFPTNYGDVLIDIKMTKSFGRYLLEEIFIQSPEELQLPANASLCYKDERYYLYYEDNNSGEPRIHYLPDNDLTRYIILRVINAQSTYQSQYA